MPLKDALGYINRFVEIEGFKVVLISNEGAFSRADASREDIDNGIVLKAFKEKLIGRTLRLVADPNEAFDSFMSQMQIEKARGIANNYKHDIVKVFRASGYENLRSLRVGLEAFDRIVSILSQKVLVKDQALREIALSCIYVAIELAATVDEEIVRDPSAGRVRRLVAGLGIGKDSKSSPADRIADGIVKRYGELVNLQRPTVSLESLVQFIAHGHLDIAKVNTAAEASLLVADPENLPPWRSLVEVWDLDTVSSQANTVRALEQLRDLSVLDPGELLHLAGIMLWRSSHGDLSLSAGKSPIEFISEYLDKLDASARSLQSQSRKMFGLKLATYGIIPIAPAEYESEISQIANMISNKVDSSFTARFPEMRMRLTEILRRPDRNFQDINAKNEVLSEFVSLPIFKNANPGEIADLILRDNRCDFEVLDWLRERYKLVSTAELLLPEAQWLQGIFNELKSRIRTAPAPFNQFWAKVVDARLKPLLSQIEELSSASQCGSRGTPSTTARTEPSSGEDGKSTSKGSEY